MTEPWKQLFMNRTWKRECFRSVPSCWRPKISTVTTGPFQSWSRLKAMNTGQKKHHNTTVFVPQSKQDVRLPLPWGYQHQIRTSFFTLKTCDQVPEGNCQRINSVLNPMDRTQWIHVNSVPFFFSRPPRHLSPKAQKGGLDKHGEFNSTRIFSSWYQQHLHCHHHVPRS